MNNESINPQKLADIWNRYTDGFTFSTVCVLNEKRRTNSILRLKEKPNLNYWAYIFTYICWIPEYCGDNPKRFRITFDWLIKNETNHVVVFDKVKQSNASTLLNHFKSEIKKGKLEHFRKYLLQGEKLDNLPPFVVNIPLFLGEIDKDMIEWAYNRLQQAK